jgi:hypothetical protein
LGRTIADDPTDASSFHAPGIAADWGVAADGSRFLVMTPERSAASASLSLIFDWQGTLDPRR